MSDSSTLSPTSPGDSNGLLLHGLIPLNEKRVSLACLRCRTKRARCSGDKPVCRACEKAKEGCIWPTGRRRKRTKREMNEEERREKFRVTNTTTKKERTSPIAWEQLEQFPEETFTTEGTHWDYSTSQTLSPPQMWVPSMNDSGLLPQYAFVDAQEKSATQFTCALEPGVSTFGQTAHENSEKTHKRFSVSTSVHPGTTRPPKIQTRPSTTDPIPRTTLGYHYNSHAGLVDQPNDLFDANNLPYPELYVPLLDTFFQTMSRHFPSINRRRIEERLESGTMSAFLLNSLCALSVRFCATARDEPTKVCIPFIEKAQALVTPLLHLPSTDVVTGLLLLAWANYGQNSDSGLWQYSGMAIHMAIDLGLHENTKTYESLEHITATRLLFWSLFVTDRIVAFSTGHTPSIPENIIEIPLPEDEDFVPDPARSDLDSVQDVPQPTPFVHMVRLMVLCGRITTALSGYRGQPRTLVPHSSLPSPSMLKDLQTELVKFYAELLDAMKWSVDTFKHQEARGHGDSFLTLHLWANAVLALAFHPELLEKPSGIDTPFAHNVDRSIKLSLSSSRIIAECLVFSDLFASHSYLTSPFAIQPIYIASLAFIHDMKASAISFGPRIDNKLQTVDNLLSTLARQNFAVLTKAIHRMEHYWAGISSISSVIEQQASVLGFQRIDFLSTKAHLGPIAPPLYRDQLRPYTTTTQLPPPIPVAVMSPTPSSVCTSMVLEEAGESGQSPPMTSISLDEFINVYNVEGMFMQPASTFDVFDVQGMLESSQYYSSSGVSTAGTSASPTDLVG